MENFALIYQDKVWGSQCRALQELRYKSMDGALHGIAMYIGSYATFGDRRAYRDPKRFAVRICIL